MMRALDLFCCGGGITRGLQNAGFRVTGVDINPQPSYCGEFFIQADALSLKPSFLATFDFIHASPPCQHSTAYKRRPGHVRDVENLIPATRDLLQRSGVPYTIENVEGARSHLHNPVLLCGSMFGLDVRRHRLFECSFPVVAPPCNHKAQSVAKFPQATNRKNLRRTVEVGVWRIPLEVQQAAMGIDWLPLELLSQAIPPAYSEWLARRFIEQREAA
jgi:DNA (cytosine-5)-methyltransferase 1